VDSFKSTNLDLKKLNKSSALVFVTKAFKAAEVSSFQIFTLEENIYMYFVYCEGTSSTSNNDTRAISQ
jgi:hypothetical protein